MLPARTGRNPFLRPEGRERPLRADDEEVRTTVAIETISFDPRKATTAEWTRHHRYRRLRHQERDPGDPLRSDASVEVSLRQSHAQWEDMWLAAVNADDPEEQVGALVFEVVKEESPDYEENKHLAWTHLSVLAPHRRQGIGTRLLAEACRLAREQGRTLLLFGTDEEDGKAFLEAIGAEVAQRTRESRLVLEEVDWEMVRAWAEEGPQGSPATTLRFFDTHLPDDLLEDFCETLSECLNQMPRDNLKRGDWIVTPETMRQWEAEYREQGAHRLTACTVEADGRISGLTEMGYFPEEEWLVHQYMTGVRLPYRGRGLGKWLKAAMLLRVRQDLPKVRVVSTGNATSNAPMLGINIRLGFKPHREGLIAQMPVEEAEAYLARKGLGHAPVRPAGWTRRDSNPGSPA